MTAAAEAQRQFLAALDDCISEAVPGPGDVRLHRFDHNAALTRLERYTLSPAFPKGVRRKLGAAIREARRKLNKQPDVWKRARIVWGLFEALPEDWESPASNGPVLASS